MKFRLSATIAIYFLLTFLFSTLYTQASQEKMEETTKLQNYSTQTHENRAKILLQKWTVFSRLLDKKHKLYSRQQQFLLQSKNNILFLIVNQFLTCKDILILQKTCRFFQNLLQPNRSNMVTFRNYADFQKMTETTIIWDDLKYLQSSYSAFNKMEMFNIHENKYAVLTCAPEKQIIVWTNNVIPYPQILLHQPTNNTTFSNQENSESNLSSNTTSSTNKQYNIFKPRNNFYPLQVFNKAENAWAIITKERNVKTGGFEDYGGKIPDDIQPQLHNVKMIIPNARQFTAVCINGDKFTWSRFQ